MHANGVTNETRAKVAGRQREAIEPKHVAQIDGPPSRIIRSSGGGRPR